MKAGWKKFKKTKNKKNQWCVVLLNLGHDSCPSPAYIFTNIMLIGAYSSYSWVCTFNHLPEHNHLYVTFYTYATAQLCYMTTEIHARDKTLVNKNLAISYGMKAHLDV